MCGIFGYKGIHCATPILENGLQRLEYRGYDSAGISIMDNLGNIKTIKSVGRVSDLSNKIDKKIHYQKSFCCGIAHTRRATHGIPSEVNTHPHCDMENKFFVVHNGIIENRSNIKQELENEGYEFYSQTDTEVIPALLSKHWNGDFLETVEKILPMLHGAYAIAICCSYCPGEIIAVKRGSPLVFGINGKEFFLSSDTQALSGYAKEVISLQDGDLIHILDEKYKIKSEGKIINKKFEVLNVNEIDSSKGEFETFMMKEIFEQPEIINKSFKGRINFSNGDIYSNSLEFIKDMDIKKIVFIGCGTSYNSGLLGSCRIQDLAGIDSIAEISSEYIYKNININNNTLYVFISQSGETADSIEVLKYIKNKGGITMGIVNTVGSSIARLTDCGFFLRAGYEIGVASTKAFTAQLVCILFLSLYIGKKRSLKYADFKEILEGLENIPHNMELILKQSKEIKIVANEISKYKNIYFLGRKYQTIIAQEGSLKLKEISYIHSEAYPSGELKHGPLALVEENFPALIIIPKDNLFDQNMSSLSEIKSRKGKVFSISDIDIPQSDFNIKIPSTNFVLMPFLTSIVVQLIAYYVAENLGRDIDKPRNLAKSVTVK